MFPLSKRVIGGYRFGEKTYYSPFHLGTDYYAHYVPLYAPFDGSVVKTHGSQGGNMIYFKPDGQDVVIRFLHLDKILRVGKVREGEQIAITGASGLTSPAGKPPTPHLHLDISKHTINLKDPRNFINPERFSWEGARKLMNKAKVVKSKHNPGVWVAYPMPSMDYLKAKCELEGIELPQDIPPSDTL